MKFKLNWKIRSQNPMFYIQIILSFFIPVLGYLGFNAVVDSTSPGIGDSNHVLCLKCLFDDCEEHELKDEEKNNKDV